jgi:hypothetical protein
MKKYAKQVAEELGVDAGMVDQIISDYWKEIKRYTYVPHEMEAGVHINKALVLHVRYAMVKRMSYLYAQSPYARKRNLGKYYEELARIQEDKRYRSKASVKPGRLENLYNQLFYGDHEEYAEIEE